MKRRERLLGELSQLERTIGTLNAQVHATAGRTFRPIRGLVLDALDDLAWPAFAREISAYIAARHGRAIAPTRFGTLIADEGKAYLNRGGRPRTVWLVPTLTWNHAEPVKRLLARSDWPLERRIIAPTTGRVQYLKITARLCEVALEVGDKAADAEMLRIVAADHARDLPGISFHRGEFPLGEWRDAALKVLREVEPRDDSTRREAAERWTSALDEAQLLFGVPEVEVGVDEPLKGRTAG